MDLDAVLRELEDEEPSVIVEPEIGAFCMVARVTTPRPAPKSSRLTLDVIRAYLANPF